MHIVRETENFARTPRYQTKFPLWDINTHLLPVRKNVETSDISSVVYGPVIDTVLLSDARFIIVFHRQN